MSIKKLLYIGTDGLPTENAGSYETTDFVSASTGVTQAGAPLKLDSRGKLDATLYVDSDIDHNQLGNLTVGDPHTQYIKVDGTRAFTGNQSHGGFKITSLGNPTSNSSNDAVPISYLNSSSAGQGASAIGIQNASSFFVATNVESALNELYTDIKNSGTKFTVNGGGVTKGDLVYISAADTISTYSTLTASQRAAGLALATTATAGTTTALTNGDVLPGVLTGATAGTAYYWSGTAHTATIPSATGAYVWQTGIAKNATDLLVEVAIVKKNA